VKKWRDLNLSATFTEFLKKVVPLSESLPQVVHHQDAIVALLEEYVAKQDELSLISLLEYFPIDPQN
jgi:U3 small nucleolar RNA-associated protein 20